MQKKFLLPLKVIIFVFFLILSFSVQLKKCFSFSVPLIIFKKYRMDLPKYILVSTFILVKLTLGILLNRERILCQDLVLESTKYVCVLGQLLQQPSAVHCRNLGSPTHLPLPLITLL